MRFTVSVLFFMSLLLFACHREEPEILNLEDILPESEKYAEGEKEGGDSDNSDPLKSVKEVFILGGIYPSEMASISKSAFPDRFGPESSEKYSLALADDTVYYSKWVYEDSVKTMNAFYNWIDCFGDNCKSIYVNQSINFQQSPMKLMVSDTTLIFIEGQSNIDFKSWDTFHEAIGYENDWNVIVEQNKWSKARWYQYVEDKKTLVKE